jgi:hypothetical protein
MVLTARRVLPDEPVNRLSDEVGMTGVPRILLDQVDQDPPQAGCPTEIPLRRPLRGRTLKPRAVLGPKKLDRCADT